MSDDFNDDKIDDEKLDIDDFLLDSQKTNFNKNKKFRSKATTTIRGITTERSTIFNKKIILISLIIFSSYGVIYIFKPSESGYIKDSSFKTIDTPLKTPESIDEQEQYSRTSPQPSSTRPRNINRPSPLSKRRRDSRTYREKLNERDEDPYNENDLDNQAPINEQPSRRANDRLSEPRENTRKSPLKSRREKMKNDLLSDEQDLDTAISDHENEIDEIEKETEDMDTPENENDTYKPRDPDDYYDTDIIDDDAL